MRISLARKVPEYQGLGCEWSRCFVLHTSGESELLHTAQAVKDKARIKQMSFFMDILLIVHRAIVYIRNIEKET
jgi:hypothetical protein